MAYLVEIGEGVLVDVFPTDFDVNVRVGPEKVQFGAMRGLISPEGQVDKQVTMLERYEAGQLIQHQTKAQLIRRRSRKLLRHIFHPTTKNPATIHSQTRKEEHDET